MPTNTPEPTVTATADVTATPSPAAPVGTPVFDLALQKELAPGSSGLVAVGDTVTFVLSVHNQGSTHATEVQVIDYLPDGLTLVDPDWTLQPDGSATTALPGILAPQTVTTVEIDLQVNEDAISLVLDNQAEIFSSSASNSTGVRLVDASGEPLRDIDSVGDLINTEDAIDNEIDNTGDDEDDHDIAMLRLESQVLGDSPVLRTEPPAEPSALAFSGSSALATALVGLAILAVGLLLVGGVRRRRCSRW